MTEAHAGYLAGIIDGEGSVMICSQLDRRYACGRDRYYYLQVSVSNTYKPLLEWIESATDRGKTYRTSGGRSLAVKPGWTWDVRGWSAADVLRVVEPFMIEKRQKALVGLEFAEARHKFYAGPGKARPVDAPAEYQRIYDKFKGL